MGGNDETSPSQLPAAGSSCGSRALPLQHQPGADLSGAAGAHPGRVRRRRDPGHRRAPDGQDLAERLGPQFIIENRPGANSNLAMETVARAPADGYTLGVVGIANVLNTTLNEKLSFDVRNDFAMVAGLSSSPLVLEVNPVLPVTSVGEFIAYAKANPGTITMASYG